MPFINNQRPITTVAANPVGLIIPTEVKRDTNEIGKTKRSNL
jgi:hypothetical protein